MLDLGEQQGAIPKMVVATALRSSTQLKSLKGLSGAVTVLVGSLILERAASANATQGATVDK